MRCIGNPPYRSSGVAQVLSCTFPTAAKLVRDFEARGWLREVTGYGRNRLWRYQPYLDLFHRDTLDPMVGSPVVQPLITSSAQT